MRLSSEPDNATGHTLVLMFLISLSPVQADVQKNLPALLKESGIHIAFTLLAEWRGLADQ
jgi:hypothetical protein